MKAVAPNPLKGWQVDPASICFIGHDLQRPECILAEREVYGATQLDGFAFDVFGNL